MDRIPIGADFIELPGEESASVKARVEGAVLFLGAAGNADSAKNLVPTLLCGSFYFVEWTVKDFVQIAHCLLLRNKGGCDI